jgi:thiamine-phosphate pyrophosphorylase
MQSGASTSRIALPPLYAIVDVDVASRAGWQPLDLAGAYLQGGAQLLQLRAKTLASGAFLDLAQSMVPLAHAAGARLIVNDRVDIALLAGADGVHVGQDDLEPADVRRLLGDQRLIGLSTHTVDQLIAAVSQPISYVAVGPVFGTMTKETGYEAVGLELVSRAVELAAPAGLPVVAIGGITRARVAEVWAAGAASAAVITDLIGDDPAARVAAFAPAAQDVRPRRYER